MKTLRSLHLVGLVSLAAIGCGAEQASPAAIDTRASVEALSAEDCAAQRDECLRDNPLFGLLSCPGQYAQCTAAAAGGIAKEVAAAVSEVADCTRAATGCLGEAGSAESRAQCGVEEAKCVASVVDVELPKVVQDTAKCVDATVDCVNGAESPADLTACGTALESCALDVAKGAVPTEVGEVIDDVTKCNNNLNGCIGEASSASGVTECTQEQVKCVADSLNVPVPQIPLAKAVECAEDATSCTLNAENARGIADCADNLRKCAVDVIDSTDAPEQLSCEKKWTVCVGNDPLKLLQCAAELAGCKD